MIYTYLSLSTIIITIAGVIVQYAECYISYCYHNYQYNCIYIYIYENNITSRDIGSLGHTTNPPISLTSYLLIIAASSYDMFELT